MAQNITIGVAGNTGAAADLVNKVTSATDDLADAMGRVEDAGKGVNQQLRSTEELARRLGAAQSILGKEFDRPIGANDAKKFLDNFDRMRGGKGLGSQRTKAYDDFEGWYQGHESSFSKKQFADRHRRFVMSVGMQGTDYAREYGAPGGGEDEPGGGGGEGSTGGGWAKRGASAFTVGKGFVMGGLALAGISGIMGSASKGLEMATDEALGTDTLKRRLGDLGIDFEALRSKTRVLGDTFGSAYAETTKLANQFAAGSGRVNSLGALDAVGVGGRFSRAFGIDPSAGVDMLAQFSRMGQIGTEKDPDGRKLAAMIGGAIKQSGYQGMPEEVIKAIVDFSDTMTKSALVNPNVGAYAGTLVGLTSSGIPGLDPSNAAAMLAQANATSINGGIRGNASKNAIWLALSRGTPGMTNPFLYNELQSGGLWATTAGMFGGTNTPSGRAYHDPSQKNRFALDDVTNLQKYVNLARASSSDPGAQANYLQGITNVTPDQALALMQMSTAKIADYAKELEQRGGEKDVGTQTRDAAMHMADSLTEIGSKLLPMTNDIREILGRILHHFGGPATAQEQQASDVAWYKHLKDSAWNHQLSPEEEASRKLAEAADARDVAAQNAGGIYNYPGAMNSGNAASTGGPAGASAPSGAGAANAGRQAVLASGDGGKGLNLSGMGLQAAMTIMGLESSGRPGVLKPSAYTALGGGNGAKGIAQWRGPRQVAFMKMFGHDILDSGVAQQIQFVNAEMASNGRLKRDFARDKTPDEFLRDWLVDYEGVPVGSKDYMNDWNAAHRLPRGHKEAGGAAQQHHHVHVSGPDHIDLHLGGNKVGSVPLKARKVPTPAGDTP